MKKIFTILLFVAMFFGATAQDFNEWENHYYATISLSVGNNVMASSNIDRPWTSPTDILIAGLRFEYPISEVVKWRIDGTLNIGRSGYDLISTVILNPSIDFHANEHIYWYISAFPIASIHGEGVQTNGDVLDIWVMLATGPGFEQKLGNGKLFVELGITRDIDIITHNGRVHDDLFMMATVGYRYLIR